MEEQIAKAEGWSSEVASSVHPERSPDAKRRPFQSSRGISRGQGPIFSLCLCSCPICPGLTNSPVPGSLP